MNKVYVWVNLLVNLSAAKVMSEFIHYGFTVTALCNQGVLAHESLVGSLLNVSLEMNTTDTPEEFAKGVETIVGNILDSNKIAYSMMLVTSPTTVARWNIGNIKRDAPARSMPLPGLTKLIEEKLN